ncbi:DUF4126 domain-containing protein [Fibrella aquatica]|jgi:Domain of unknown function (DUF4126)|uniref:DUF4126 domain-containing protein n=1 Tax=Fibrella aquatica TaxID=3242487 RepID=UPI0035223204
MIDWILSACVGLGLAACCGFRVFVPMLVAAFATKLGLINAMPGYEFMGSWTVIISLSVATAFELGAYYIPWLDNMLDTVAMPVAIVAGTLLSTSFLRVNDEMVRWAMSLMLGGGAAGLVQAGTSLLRIGSVTTTGGLANPLVATGENAASLILSILTVFLPLFAFAVIVCLLIFLVVRLLSRKKLRFTQVTPKPSGNPLDQFPQGSNGNH